MKERNNNLWLWSLSAVSVAIWVAIFILLNPDDLDYELQHYRALGLVICMITAGLCAIIATRDRWFGKNS